MAVQRQEQDNTPLTQSIYQKLTNLLSKENVAGQESIAETVRKLAFYKPNRDESSNFQKMLTILDKNATGFKAIINAAIDNEQSVNIQQALGLAICEIDRDGLNKFNDDNKEPAGLSSPSGSYEGYSDSSESFDGVYKRPHTAVTVPAKDDFKSIKLFRIIGEKTKTQCSANGLLIEVPAMIISLAAAYTSGMLSRDFIAKLLQHVVGKGAAEPISYGYATAFIFIPNTFINLPRAKKFIQAAVDLVALQRAGEATWIDYIAFIPALISGVANLGLLIEAFSEVNYPQGVEVPLEIATGLANAGLNYSGIVDLQALFYQSRLAGMPGLKSAIIGMLNKKLTQLGRDAYVPKVTGNLTAAQEKIIFAMCYASVLPYSYCFGKVVFDLAYKKITGSLGHSVGSKLLAYPVGIVGGAIAAFNKALFLAFPVKRIVDYYRSLESCEQFKDDITWTNFFKSVLTVLSLASSLEIIELNLTDNLYLMCLIDVPIYGINLMGVDGFFNFCKEVGSKIGGVCCATGLVQTPQLDANTLKAQALRDMIDVFASMSYHQLYLAELRNNLSGELLGLDELSIDEFFNFVKGEQGVQHAATTTTTATATAAGSGDELLPLLFDVQQVAQQQPALTPGTPSTTGYELSTYPSTRTSPLGSGRTSSPYSSRPSSANRGYGQRQYNSTYGTVAAGVRRALDLTTSISDPSLNWRQQPPPSESNDRSRTALGVMGGNLSNDSDASDDSVEVQRFSLSSSS